jgi:hypothetical protein
VGILPLFGFSSLKKKILWIFILENKKKFPKKEKEKEKEKKRGEMKWRIAELSAKSSSA